MFDLKFLNPEAIPAALEKAERYRLLSEPEQAESICEDVLRIDSGNPQAVTTLMLALTDRLADSRPAPLAQAKGEYESEYDAGISAESELIA